MPDFPTFGGGGRQEEGGGVTGDSKATTLTTGAADTKGSYVELIAATAFEAFGIYLSIAGGGKRDFLIDLAVGAAASEQDIVPNILYTGHVDLTHEVFLPIGIPAGSRVSVRAQASAATQTMDVNVHLFGKSFLNGDMLARVTAYGVNTADTGGVSIDPGGTANTKGAWSEIVASTGNNLKALLFCIGVQDNVGRTNADHLFDVAVGAASSEQVIIANLMVVQDAQKDHIFPSMFGPYPAHIPSGTRLAVRQQCSITDAADRLADVTLYGFD